MVEASNQESVPAAGTNVDGSAGEAANQQQKVLSLKEQAALRGPPVSEWVTK